MSTFIPDVRFISLIGLILALPVSAGDGRLEINQACIGGGCFSGDSSGFPVELAQSGSYILTSDISVNQNTSAIAITADNVTLDLNGHSIAGPVTCSGDPVSSCSSTGIGDGITISADRASIRNGTIDGMGRFGIVIDLSGGHRIANLTVSQSGDDGIRVESTASDASNSLVQNVSLYRNGEDGIEAFGRIYVLDSLLLGNGRAGQEGGWCRGVVFDGNELSSSCTAVNPNE